jgi:HD-GYP domain-containing protein (c-di-GMP phosphodiesterase class II)
MTSNRPYGLALNTERALEALEQFAGAQFDPDLVNVALDSGAQLEDARLKFGSKKTGDYFN